MTTHTQCYSFPPVADKHACILILGSMPGVESLRQQQYYAHPRNAFWSVMAALFGINLDDSYQYRCQGLIKNGIAVWDVMKACQRRGSLDQHIDDSSIEANDFNHFLSQHPEIKQILFNGSKAEQVFIKHVLNTLDEPFRQIPRQRLPSTSPAHAAMNQQTKITIWKEAIDNTDLS